MMDGYARVSTATQGRDGNSLEEQVSALTAYGCQEIIQEAFTGKTMERPAFQALIQKLTPQDTLVVTKLDRFARTAICCFCEGEIEHYHGQDPKTWGRNPDNACSIEGARCCKHCDTLIVQPVRAFTRMCIRTTLPMSVKQKLLKN
jgi:hypothetical protein